jgi:excinuclease UvrABC nuclease subunit
MTVVETGGDLAALDTALANVPNEGGVFLLWAGEGEPYLARTALLRRRLLRLLRERAQPGRLLNLRHTVRRIEYEATGSPFESSVRMYELAREHFPETYLQRLKLRMPPWVKITLSNPYPRSTVTTQIARTAGVFYGPFSSRSTAERFESEFLDLFQMRRCQEDLAPSPEHPGCIYGEMGMCLRPCQQVVGAEEYAHEVARVVEFLGSGGRSLLDTIRHARDRFSEQLDFEEAARQHKRYEKVEAVLALSDEMCRRLDCLHGVAITASIEPAAVELWPVRAGNWVGRRRLSFEIEEGKPVSLDRRLRELLADLPERKLSARERQEYLAISARWFYSSWREGEWVPFEDFEHPPWRRMVHAVSRVARRRE